MVRASEIKTAEARAEEAEKRGLLGLAREHWSQAVAGWEALGEYEEAEMARIRRRMLGAC